MPRTLLAAAVLSAVVAAGTAPPAEAQTRSGGRAPARVEALPAGPAALGGSFQGAGAAPAAVGAPSALSPVFSAAPAPLPGVEAAAAIAEARAAKPEAPWGGEPATWLPAAAPHWGLTARAYTAPRIDAALSSPEVRRALAEGRSGARRAAGRAASSMLARIGGWLRSGPIADLARPGGPKDPGEALDAVFEARAAKGGVAWSAEPATWYPVAERHWGATETAYSRLEPPRTGAAGDSGRPPKTVPPSPKGPNFLASPKVAAAAAITLALAAFTPLAALLMPLIVGAASGALPVLAVRGRRTRRTKVLAAVAGALGAVMVAAASTSGWLSLVGQAVLVTAALSALAGAMIE